MSPALQVEQAARLHRAEVRWLAHCAQRLRDAAIQQPAGPPARAEDEERTR